MHIEVLRSESDLHALREEWNALLQISQTDSVFSTYEWLSTWWQCYGEGKRLALLAARQDDRLIGLAPFVALRREGFTEAALMGGQVTDYKDFIIDAGANRQAVLEQMLTQLIAAKTVDMVQLDGLREDSPNFAPLVEAMKHLRPWRPLLQEHTVSPYVLIEGDWDDYQHSLGKKTRQSTRQRINKLEQDYGITRYTCSASEEEARDAVASFIQQKIEHWHATKQTRLQLEDERMQGFYHRLAQSMFRVGWLRMFTLCVNGVVAATILGLEYGGKFYSCQHSHNIAFEKYSTGRLLILHILEEAFSHHLREFDMLVGDEAYKQSYRPHIRKVYNLSLFQNGPRGYLAEAWVRRARPWLAQNAQKNHLLQPLNQLARRLKQKAG